MRYHRKRYLPHPQNSEINVFWQASERGAPGLRAFASEEVARCLSTVGVVTKSQSSLIWQWVKTVMGSHLGVGAPPILVYLVGIGMLTGGTGF